MPHNAIESSCPHCDHVAPSKYMLANHCSLEHRDIHDIVIVNEYPAKVKCLCGQWRPMRAVQYIGRSRQFRSVDEQDKYDVFEGPYEEHWYKVLFSS